MRALARDPERRYPSAAAFLSDLQAVSEGQAIGQLPDAIAILDFDNLSENPTHAWIATGVAEALATDLRKVQGLEVLPRERVLKVRAAIGGASSESSAAAIGLRLGCRWVLAGAYQVVGEALRVTMRLVETATEKTVATEKVDGSPSDLFQMQDRLAAVTVSALNLNLRSERRPPIRPSLTAYESYIRGRRLFLRLEKGSMDQARQFYEDAIQLEPSYVLALCGLAAFHAMQYNFTTDSPRLEAAACYAQRAIETDATSADAWNWVGYAHLRLGRLDDAYAERCRATQLDPLFFFPWYHLGNTCAGLGKLEEGPRYAQRAVELEPDLSYPIWALACWLMQLGQYDEALWAFQRTAVVDRAAGAAAQWPGHGGVHGECLRRMGRLSEARDKCMAGLQDVEASDHMFRDTNRVVCLNALGRTALQQGDTEAARAAYGQAIEHVQGRQNTLAGGCLVVQALAGLSRAAGDRRSYAEAVDLYVHRRTFDFSQYWLCFDDMTLLDLSRAALTLGIHDDAATWQQQAAEHGSFEAQHGAP